MFPTAPLVALAAYLVDFASAGPTPSKCVTQFGGNLWTAPYTNQTTGKTEYKPYTWNTQNYVGFYNNGPREYVYVEWQTCTPNYYNSANPNDGLEEGRFYLPSTKSCLAILTSYESTGYIVGSAPCPNSAEGKETSTQSVSFNFQGRKGYNGYWYIGTTKADGSQTQGASTDGRFFVDAFPGGEPKTIKTDDHQVHLVATNGTNVPYNLFVVRD